MYKYQLKTPNFLITFLKPDLFPQILQKIWNTKNKGPMYLLQDKKIQERQNYEHCHDKTKVQHKTNELCRTCDAQYTFHHYVQPWHSCHRSKLANGPNKTTVPTGVLPPTELISVALCIFRIFEILYPLTLATDVSMRYFFLFFLSSFRQSELQLLYLQNTIPALVFCKSAAYWLHS